VKELKLGLQMGYLGAGPDPRMVEVAQQAEQLGYDVIFTKDRPSAWRESPVTALLANNRNLSHVRSLVELALG
jgi:alkanesulfonate monooxygenase SsuD/methylene tetrahydromethanopterin reductase-like flavin-dependent oxidoreductase (luciferase family)|tara:strand:- start:132 stop:350 length:219 start_codon:yes stop_codon:yes gene_type:complete